MGLFSFTRCITTTLDICLHWILIRVQFGQSRGVPFWGFLPGILSERAARVSPPKFLGGLHSCCWYFCCFPLVWRFCTDLTCPFVPCSWVFPKYFVRTTLRLQAMSQEVLYLPFGVIIYWWRKSHWILFLDIRQAYFDGRLYSDLVSKERST